MSSEVSLERYLEKMSSRYFSVPSKLKQRDKRENPSFTSMLNGVLRGESASHLGTE